MYFQSRTVHFLHQTYHAVLLTVAALLFCLPLYAGGDTKAQKAYRKQCKQEVKRLQQEGWKVYATTQTLEDLLMPYYMELADGAQFINEQQTGRDINEAMTKARHFAQVKYASAVESIVTSEAKSEMENEDTGDEATSSKTFQARVRSKVQQRVSCFLPRFTLTRDTPEGKTEVMQFYTYKLEE